MRSCEQLNGMAVAIEDNIEYAYNLLFRYASKQINVHLPARMLTNPFIA